MSGFVPAHPALKIARIVDLYERAELLRAVEQARVASQLTAAFGWAPSFDAAGNVHVTREQFDELRSLTRYNTPTPVCFPDGASAKLWGISVIVDE